MCLILPGNWSLYFKVLPNIKLLPLSLQRNKLHIKVSSYSVQGEICQCCEPCVVAPPSLLCLWMVMMYSLAIPRGGRRHIQSHGTRDTRRASRHSLEDVAAWTAGSRPTLTGRPRATVQLRPPLALPATTRKASYWVLD